MPVDQTPPIQVAPAPNWELPEITDVIIRPANFKPKAPVNFAHPMDAVANAMEIIVSLEAPVPVRARYPPIRTPVGVVTVVCEKATGGSP